MTTICLDKTCNPLIVRDMERTTICLKDLVMNDKIRENFRNKLTEVETGKFFQLITDKAIQLFRQGHLVLFDAVTGTNQCHITALLITSLYQRCLERTSFQLSEKEQRLVVLSFFTASCFNINRKALAELLMKPGQDKPLFIKLMSVFLDEQGIKAKDLKASAKEQVIRVINDYIHDLLPQVAKNTPALLTQELERMTKEGGTYPKFPGVYIMMNLVMQKNIPLVLKIKFVCSTGTHRSAYLIRRARSEKRPLSGLAPVIVIEGYASSNFSTKEVFAARNNCPGVFSIKSHKKGNEAETAKCCAPCPKGKECPDLVENKKKLDRISGAIPKLMLAEAADFTVQVQKEFRDLFRSGADAPYPSLAGKFGIYLQYSQDNGLSSDCPKTLVIEHVYPDTANFALNKQRLVDTTSGDVLEGRGVA